MMLIIKIVSDKYITQSLEDENNCLREEAKDIFESEINLINKKEVWAANIGKEQMVEQELSRYLENDGLMAKIWEQIAKMSGVK